MISHREYDAPGGQRTPGAPQEAPGGVALSGHLFDLEARLVSLVLRETLQRQREFATLAHAVFRLYAWPFVKIAPLLEMQDIGHRSFELLLTAQTAFIEALFGGRSAGDEPAGDQPTGDQPAAGRRVQSERRVSALIINFPERRIDKH